MLDFTNKTVIVTGASRGIGEASAHYFSDLNANVVLAARSKNKIEEIANKLGKNALAIECDVADPSQVNHLMMKSSKAFGTIDVLINNAGCAFNGPLVEMDLGQWEKTIQINLTSVFQICSSIVPQMRKNGGLVINVSSHASYNAFPQWGAYCISKSALSMFTKCLREEERSNSIRACTITLGSVNTPLWDSESINSDFDRTSMLSSSDVSDTILYMAQKPESQLIEDLTLMPSGGAF